MRPAGDAHGPHPAVTRQVVGSPVLRGAAARLPVQTKKQVRVVMRLRPPVRVEQILVRAGIDVRHSVRVPQDLGPFDGLRRRGRRIGAATREREREKREDRKSLISRGGGR